MTLSKNTIKVDGTTTWEYTDYLESSGTWTFKNQSYLNVTEVKEMCQKYPGLDKAWNNFKSMYDLIKDDYENNK